MEDDPKILDLASRISEKAKKPKREKAKKPRELTLPQIQSVNTVRAAYDRNGQSLGYQGPVVQGWVQPAAWGMWILFAVDPKPTNEP